MKVDIVTTLKDAEFTPDAFMKLEKEIPNTVAETVNRIMQEQEQETKQKEKTVPKCYCRNCKNKMNESMKTKALINLSNYQLSLNQIADCCYFEMIRVYKNQENREKVQSVLQFYRTKIEYLSAEWKKLIPEMNEFFEAQKERALKHLDNEFNNCFR